MAAAGSPAQPVDESVAVALLSLLFAQRQDPTPDTPDSWVRRRVERIAVIDESSVRHHWSIDFELPATIAGAPTDDLPYVPLSWFRRGTRLRDVSLTDEDGRRIPIATARQSGELAIAAMTAYGRHLARLLAPDAGREPPAELHADVLEDLRAIAVDRDKRGDALERFRAARGDAAQPDEQQFQRAMIMGAEIAGRDVSLRGFVEELATSYVLLAVLPGSEAQRRRELVLTWVEHGPDGTSLATWIASHMAWRPIVLSMKPRNVDSTQSYCLELGSPSDEIEVVRGALVVGQYERPHGVGYPRLVAQIPDADVDRDPAHLRFSMDSFAKHAGRRGAEIAPLATFVLRASRVGFVRLALLACALSTMLLALGLWHLDAVRGQVDGAATLLLVVPGLLSLFVLRPGEHRLATELFSGVRCMVVTSAISVLTAGALLLVDLDRGWLKLWWTGLLLISAMTLLAVLASNALPQSRRAPRLPEALPDDPGATSEPSSLNPVVAWLVAALMYRPFRAMCLYLAICGACFAVALELTGGREQLGIERRLDATLAQPRDGRVALWSFAGVPWTRMHVFGPQTTREQISSAVGRDALAAGTHLRPIVARGTTLFVLVDGARVVTVFELMTSQADAATLVASGRCALRPTDELIVGARRALSRARQRASCARA